MNVDLYTKPCLCKKLITLNSTNR